jgi:2-polyprenyl-6-methoxyphenol hydroxylase-like FAD-dependent oxidoreductase
MLIDLAQRRPDFTGTAFDVCVIGGGVAGITIAAKLGAAGRHVLLIEAGGREPNARSQAFYRGATGELENLPLDRTRVRALGGASHHWGGCCRPLDAHDFSRSDFSPDGTWPIRKSDVDPYFREAATILRISEMRGADLDLAAADHNLETIRMYFSTPPANLGALHFEALRQSPNVLLLINAAYVGMTLDGPRVDYIDVKDPRSPARLPCRARIFVFAMGAVENTRHLLIHNRKGASDR